MHCKFESFLHLKLTYTDYYDVLSSIHDVTLVSSVNWKVSTCEIHLHSLEPSVSCVCHRKTALGLSVIHYLLIT